ncbi:SufD family Fe-S cluster assembly protein [Acidiferrimicrobium sp. IK]|uniref:SufB/SufD family protein n=1 Tax=Acidiferrimicrobium sp. IK TaxID=2871700 RepID=UPI0021CB3D3F|nr:SufD family Fe-S cluster assembly protein [Acidiferrimicrobium sp. IK]MCU4187510.1 SufD family Fe-S cluster assembly protein [Acidiferrimicrobium sp. IK]
MAGLPGPAWLSTARTAAFERFSATPLPTEAAEEWRYSRIAELDLERFAPVSHGEQAGAAAPPAGLSADVLEALLLALAGAVVVEVGGDGTVAVTGAHPAVSVTDLSGVDAPEAPLGAIAGEPDSLVSLNLALSSAPVVIDVERTPDGDELPTVVVVHRVGAPGAAVFPRLLVRVARNADASVVEVLAGGGEDDESLVVPVTELEVGDAGRLGYVHVQLLGHKVWQLALHSSSVGRDATLTSAAISLGGDYARVRTDSSLVAPGGTSKLLAVYFADGHQMHDLRTKQDHRARQTTSDLYFKGVVANRSRSVYTGLIRVEKGARGTNAFQTNRNLVLHEGAHADSVPNLEIEDNDVSCSHASAVGPVDADQLFYLESRGVPTESAERLIALGFLDEVLDRLPTPALVAPLRLALAAKLDEAERIETAMTGVQE